MLHFAARARTGSLLFRNWVEARELWDQVVRRVRVRALVLMPDHIHALVTDARQVRNLRRALRGFALWRNHHRGEKGPVWQHGEEPTPVRGRQHVERTRRYIHLNPCRRGLVADPLEWAFSTHRDAVGLALSAVCSTMPDPERFHTWITSDPSVAPEGSALPAGPGGNDRSPGIEEILCAVSALTRSPVERLSTRGPARRLLICAASSLTEASARQIAQIAGSHPATVRRLRGHRDRDHDRHLKIIRRILGDPRFPSLLPGDLRRLPAWHFYNQRD